MQEKTKDLESVRCPYCNSKYPVLYNRDSIAEGLYVRCKARHCKREFEIKIDKTNLTSK